MMSSGEDWYPLAPRDLQSSSDDEQAKPHNEVGGTSDSIVDAHEHDALGTPCRLEARTAISPSSSGILSGPPFSSDALRSEREPLGKDADHRSSSPRIFEEPFEDTDGASGTAQERWQRTNAYMQDVQSAFRSRPALRVRGNECYMKILLVGEPGLGKDMFIKNTFASYCADNDLPVNSCRPDVEPHAFRRTASEFCTEVLVDVDDGRTKIHYLLQDTPGTHMLGSEAAVLNYVQRQNQAYMAMEEDPRRVVPLSALPDPRVDVCLFFLSPHFLKPQDVALMTRLSEFVPIVPLIAKADALTTEELNSYRNDVREKLQNMSLQVGRPIMHNFAAADLKAAGAVRDVPPFAVITSSEVDHEVGSHWFTRTFPWGRCEVMSSNHSDLPALKRLLFETCFEGFKAGTEARFYAARENHLTARALSRALSSGELPPDIKTPAKPDAPKPSGTPRLSSGPRGGLPHSAAQDRLAYARHVAAKKEKAGSQRWGWGLGVTLGVVTIAILLQIAALGIYSKNTSHLKSLVDAYQRESAAEKQVIAELIRSLDLD